MVRLKRWAAAACIGALTGLLVFAVLAARQRRQLDAPLTCGHSWSWFSKVLRSGPTDGCVFRTVISMQRRIASAASWYLNEHGEYPASLDALGKSTYYRTEIDEQRHAYSQYKYSFVHTDDGLYILASSSKHKRVFVLFVGGEFSGSAFNKAGASTGGP